MPVADHPSRGLLARLPPTATKRTSPGPLAWQPSFEEAEPTRVAGHGDPPAARIALDAVCWVDHAPGWLAGSGDLLDALLHGLDWQSGTRTMYERRVTVPRLWAMLDLDDPVLPAIISAMAGALEARYDQAFDHLGINLYRSGADSVTWHADRIGRIEQDPLIALVSLGCRRPFILKPAAGGPAQRFLLGQGDLLVMGGGCQHRWLHAVPKVARAGPRISLSFRHGPRTAV